MRAVLGEHLPPQFESLYVQSTRTKRQHNYRYYKAANATNIHDALRLTREALGFSNTEMRQAIASQLSAKPIPASTLDRWELVPEFPEQAILPSYRSFPGSDVITVYGAIMEEHGRGQWWKQHETHFRTLLYEARTAQTSCKTPKSDRRPTGNER